MSANKAQLFILYQMGSSEDYTWYSVVAVFLSESALMDHARQKSIDAGLSILEANEHGEVVLPEPREFVAVRSVEGEVPDVELGQKF
ncbi:MAG: hypothetical protein OK449_07075 [Thaumarchaeota archaeon]|nr:hypothetical protein [Nitrososphaerota archaeon]